MKFALLATTALLVSLPVAANQFDQLYQIEQQTKQAEAFAQTQQQWRNEVVNDKEIGGQALAENLGYAAKVLDTFAPDLRGVLDETGLGNHPAFVKAFVKIGKAISEDRLVGGAQQTPGAAQDPAAKLFPNMNQ